MLPKNRTPTHPGEMLLKEFLEPLGITQKDFAERIGISRVRLNELIRGKRGITADTALRLAKALGTTPQFWLHGQASYDLAVAQHTVVAQHTADIGGVEIIKELKPRKTRKKAPRSKQKRTG